MVRTNRLTAPVMCITVEPIGSASASPSKRETRPDSFRGSGHKEDLQMAMQAACCGADTGKDAGLGTFSTVRTSLWVPASVLAGEAVNAQADAPGV